MRSSPLCEKCSNGVLTGLGTPARRGWSTFRSREGPGELSRVAGACAGTQRANKEDMGEGNSVSKDLESGHGGNHGNGGDLGHQDNRMIMGCSH